MSFDPAHLGRVARQLPGVQTFDKEARVRSSLGRSYYALFLAVRREICQQTGLHVDNEIGHGELKNVLFSAGSSIPDARITAVATLLSTLYDQRQKADYKLDPAPPWPERLKKPKFAEGWATQVEEAIRKLPQIDFRSIKL